MDREEAAIAIQKAFRGYTVRKAYGPLINKATGQIDEETAGFLRRYANKWKSRSIFQVLLQYRAVRYQDLVNLSQQVHIYNQGSMQGLVDTSACILLDRIDPQAKYGEFLGAMLPTVHKLPFRLDKMQYFDSTYLCDPVSHNRDTLASQDSDPETWDEPLRRRPTTSTRIRASVQNQTYVQPKQAQPIQTSVQSLIHTPFCRDPTQPIKKLAPQPSDSPFKSPKPDNVYSPAVYKKRQASPQTISYQSPKPWSSQKDNHNNIIETPKLRETKQTNVFQQSDQNKNIYDGALQNNINNPIKELQELAKTAKTETATDDDAPFNFQAMLRKTPRNRESMKRTGEVKLEAVEMSTPNYKKKSHAPPRPRSCQELKRIDSVEQFKLGLKSKDRTNYMNLNGNSNWIELAPGLKIEGQVVDL